MKSLGLPRSKQRSQHAAVPGKVMMPPAHQPKNLQLDQQLCFAMYSASHAMTRSYKRALVNVGLTYPQYLVMLVVWEHDGVGISKIADILDLDTSSVTPVIKRLEAAGLLMRSRVPGDDRLASMKVLPQGWAIQQQVADIQKEMACRSGVEGEEFERLRVSLLQVSERMRLALEKHD
jgi:DNA-binding MarR family transcriptional regulator